MELHSVASTLFLLLILPGSNSNQVKIFSHLNECHSTIFYGISHKNQSATVVSAHHYAITRILHLSHRNTFYLVPFYFSVDYRNWRNDRPLNHLSQPYLTRHSQCFVHLYQTQKIFPNQDLINSISGKWKASYVILLGQVLPPASHIIYMFRSSLYCCLSIFVVKNLTEIVELCRYSKFTWSTSESIKRSSMCSHLDFNQEYIKTDLELEEINRLPLSSCDMLLYGIKYPPPTVELCVIREIQAKYNFSVTTKYSFVQSLAVLKRRTRLSHSYIMDDVKPNRRVPIELGLVFESWGYLIIQEITNGDEFSNNDITLKNPFSTSIWVFIGLSYLLMSILMIVESLLSFTKRLENMRTVMLDVTIGPARLFGSLLEQSSCPPTTKQLPIQGLQGKMHYMNWLLWYFMMYIVSQMYKGKMFSSLTFLKDLAFPESLEELAGSQFPIITFIGTSYKNKWDSVIKVNLREAIESGTHPKFYSTLLNITTYKHDWLFAMRKFSILLYQKQNDVKLNPYFVRRSGYQEIYEKSIGELDLLKHVRMQKQILEIFSPNKWTSPAVPVHNFMTCMPWTVTNNVFYKVFKTGLGQIFESGLYNRWDSYHDDINGIFNFHEVEKGVIPFVRNLKFSIPKVYWRNYYFFKKGYPTKKEAKLPHAVEWQAISSIWSICLCFFCLSTIVLSIEIIHLKFDAMMNIRIE